MKNIAKVFLSALLAGMCIGIAGTVYLSVENTVIGAVLFAMGLFIICTRGLFLFTGQAGYLLDNKLSFLGRLALVWLGNLAGTALVGYAVRMTRVTGVAERAAKLAEIKLADNLLSIFVLAFFCGILMFLAVDGYRNHPHPGGKYLGILFCVPVFILCGFEHCIANMFYFSAANAWSLQAVGYLLVMTLGNLIGSIVFYGIEKIAKK